MRRRADTGPIDDRQVVTADLVILTLREKALHVGLLQRENPPFEGREALVGAYVHAANDASIEATAARALREKTGLDGLFLEQLHTFSGPSRDPRGWSVSVAHLALVPWHRLEPMVGQDRRLGFRPVDAVLGSLPFDHDTILQTALARLRGKGAYSTLPARFLPDVFTLAELRETYEVALGAGRIDVSSFRRKMTEMALLEEAGDTTATGGRRAKLYRLREPVSLFSRRI